MNSYVSVKLEYKKKNTEKVNKLNKKGKSKLCKIKEQNMKGDKNKIKINPHLERYMHNKKN